MCTVLSPRIILSLVITLALADFCVLTTRWRTFAFVVLTILAYPVPSSSHVFTNSETTKFFRKIFFALFFYSLLNFFNWDQNTYTKKSDWTLCICLKNQRRFRETNSWNQNSSKHVMSSFLFDSFQRNWKFSHQSVNKLW